MPLSANDIAIFTDDELDEYLEFNARLEFLGFQKLKLLIFMHRYIHVEDPENLPQEFIERLRYGIFTILFFLTLSDINGRTRAGLGAAANSCRIDFHFLMERLESISANRPSSPKSSSLASTIDLSDEENYHLNLEEQTEHYNALVNEGGRPSHPVSLGRDVAKDPGGYHEILSFWQSHPDDWMVFERQMGEWRRFREYQQRHRNEGCFPQYVVSVKRRMAQHEFKRPFELSEDLEQQDKLVTWIEFLYYEYWQYDKDMSFVEGRQPKYDEAWKELVDSQVLRPFETEKFICSISSAIHHQSDKERAERDLKSAKSIVMSVQASITEPQPSSLLETLQQQFTEAQSKVDAANESLASIKRRNDIVHKFFQKTGETQMTNDGKLRRSYLSAKDDAERRGILLRWILQQLPLIEHELNPVHTVEKTSIEAVEGVRQRPKRDRTDDPDEERVSKRQYHGGQSSIMPAYTTRGSAVKALKSQLKGQPRNSGDDMLPTRPRRTCCRVNLHLPLRRSTRMRRPPDRFQ